MFICCIYEGLKKMMMMLPVRRVVVTVMVVMVTITIARKIMVMVTMMTMMTMKTFHDGFDTLSKLFYNKPFTSRHSSFQPSLNNNPFLFCRFHEPSELRHQLRK